MLDKIHTASSWTHPRGVRPLNEPAPTTDAPTTHTTGLITMPSLQRLMLMNSFYSQNCCWIRPQNLCEQKCVQLLHLVCAWLKRSSSGNIHSDAGTSFTVTPSPYPVTICPESLPASPTAASLCRVGSAAELPALGWDWPLSPPLPPFPLLCVELT